jgi:hypothetical protein
MSRSVVCLLLAALGVWAQPQSYDVVVYGGTAGGVMAAVSAAREGLRVALVEPTAHIGGMVSGGLGETDIGKREVIGGLALEFYLRLGDYYHVAQYKQNIAWNHEPHAAERIFRQMLREANVELYERQRLRERHGVRKEGPRVVEMELESGLRLGARVFVDSSYEGDLMAQSGVTWTYGRESSAQYGEPLAGVREQTPYHQFLVDVDARDASGALLPEVSAGEPLAPGSADRMVQAYNYRMCLTTVSANRVSFARPANYDARRYALLARLIEARTASEGHVPSIHSLMKIDAVPNGKTDVNNNGAFSTDYIGGSWAYPTADYAQREAIARAHRDYIAGFFYFLANDAAIPAPLRAEVASYGLCKDEFADNGNWPYQLYVRESRRMVGGYVATQKDLQTELTKPDPIGMGSYNSDSHNVERIADSGGHVRNEGDMQVAVKPYQIAYRVMVPRRTEAVNLLVPVAFSASHVAYSSLRMEPQYMILGHAAGLAAKLAIDARVDVQAVDTHALTARLRQQGAVLEYRPSMEQELVPRLRLDIERRAARNAASGQITH